MNNKISEDKREVIVDKLHELEDAISKLYHTLEEDELIPDNKFNNVYDKLIEELNNIHTNLLEEVTLN
jgi:hypothetical protein